MEEEKPKVPKTYLTKAYVKQLEKGLYGLFRNLEFEDDKGVREKVKEIGPIRLLREAKMPDEDKQVVLKTYDPIRQIEIGLVDVGTG